MRAIFLQPQTAKPQYISLFFKFLCRHWFVRLFSTFDSLYQTLCLYLKSVFVWRWNRKDVKFWKENRKENVFRVCLVRWGERKINSRERVLGCFLLGPTKNFLPKMGEIKIHLVDKKRGPLEDFIISPKIGRKMSFPNTPHVGLHLQCIGFYFYFIFFNFNEVSIYIQFFKSIMCYFFLFNSDIMVILYKLYFQPNKKVFHPSIFLPSQPNTIEGN